MRLAAAIRCHAGPAGGVTAAFLLACAIRVCGEHADCRENTLERCGRNVGSVRVPLVQGIFAFYSGDKELDQKASRRLVKWEATRLSFIC